MQETIRVLLADDHAVVREGLEAILETQPDIEVIGTAKNGREAIALARELEPDVLLTDIEMPFVDGVAVVAALHESHPHIHTLILTSFSDDRRVFAAIKAGALGYLLKDTPRQQLLKSLREVAQGQASLHPAIAMKVLREMNAGSAETDPATTLTDRELETLRYLAQGLTNQEISTAMTVHVRTIAKYVGSILTKLHLANRTQAALYALRNGISELG